MPKIKPYIYAVAAADAYNDVPGVLPSGWRAGIDATQAGYATNGYFGRTYVNDANKQFIIAHRGTSNIANLLTDAGLFLTGYSDVFLTNVSPFVLAVNNSMVSQGYSFVGVTGHSLGAANAVLTWHSFKEAGLPIEVTVFELPVPTYITDFRGVNIYNVAPNLVNTLSSPITSSDVTITRIYRPFDLPSFNFGIPPNGIIPSPFSDYWTFMEQQHKNMSTIVNQFNPITGLPKISSIEHSWPSGYSAGYDYFISYKQNPYLLNSRFLPTWQQKLASNDPGDSWVKGASLWQYASDVIQYLLSPSSVPQPDGNKIINGDDSGNDFFGGNTVGNIFNGGVGDDKYRIVGQTLVTDIGGANSYYLYSPLNLDGIDIYDANPQLARVFNDSVPISGNALAITKIASPLPAPRRLEEHHPHLRGADKEAELDAIRWNPDEAAPRRAQSTGDLGYVIPASSSGRAFLAKHDAGGSFDIGDTLSNIAGGNALSIPGFRSGDFGIQLPSQAPITFGVSSIYEVSIKNLSTQLHLSSTSNAIQYDGTDKSGWSVVNGMFFLGNDGKYTDVSIVPINPTKSLLYGGTFASLPSGTFAFFTVEDYNAIRYFYLRIFDKNSNSVCNLPHILGGNPYFTIASSQENFIFASSDISAQYSAGFDNSIFMYTISPACSIVSKQLLTGYPSSAVPLSLLTNNEVTVLITQEHGLAGSNSFNSNIYFYDKNLTMISKTPLLDFGSFIYPFFGVDLSSAGRLVSLNTISSLTSSNYYDCYLSIINSTGVISQIVIGHNVDARYMTYIIPTWIRDDAFVILMKTSTGSLALQQYDDNGNLLQTLMSTSPIPKGNFSSSLVTSVVRASDTSSKGTIFASWVDTSTGSSGVPTTLHTAIVPFGTNEPDVIVGTKQASDIDCSKSQALLCYAMAQEGDGDILTAFIGQNAVLVGSEYGAKIFTFLPSVGRRLSSGDGRELQSSTGVIELWNVKPNDSFNFSALGISGATVSTSGHYDNGTFVPESSSLHIPGFAPINILHSANSAPFNLTISADGSVVALPIYVAHNESNASAASGVVVGSMSQTETQSATHYMSTFPSASTSPFSMSPSPSNILLPAAQAAENSGVSTAGLALGTAAIAGISAGGFVVVAAAGVIGYFVYRSYKANSMITPKNEDSSHHEGDAEAVSSYPGEFVYSNPMSPTNPSYNQGVEFSGAPGAHFGDSH